MNRDQMASAGAKRLQLPAAERWGLLEEGRHGGNEESNRVSNSATLRRISTLPALCALDLFVRSTRR
jgi:hypothetical protein